jgi:hypothetical protein
VRAVGGVVRRLDSGIVVAGVVAVGLFWVAYENGSYELASRAPLAIVVWWAVILGVTLSLFGTARLSRATYVVGGALVGLACWTLASALWAPSAEDAFAEFDRVSLYLGVYLLAVLSASRRVIGRWADGLAIGIAAVAVVSLVSRLFPDSFSDRGLAAALPSAATRLSFPLGYWNGLAIFVALGVPLLLRIALVGRSSLTRGLALAPLPVIACVVYLASSRGGVVTAVVGTLAVLVLTERRWMVVVAITVSGVASAGAIAALLDRNQLVNGPLGTDAVRDQGRSAALLVALACVGAGVLYGIADRLLAGRLQLGARTGHVVVAAAAVVALVALVLSDPISRFETFREVPEPLEAIDRGDFVTTHLLSGGGNGRWQFWSSSVDAWEDHPVLGVGAGSFEHWWAEHAPHTQFVRDGHSLYLESLGELGLVGFLLIVALAGVGVGVGALRALRSTGDARVTTSALTGAFVAYAVAAGFDWVWELTAVGVVGVAALALVTGPATETPPRLRTAAPGEREPWAARRRFGAGLVVVLAAWAIIVAQVIPLLADRELARSREAVERRDLDEGLEAAGTARDIQPWASGPYLQLALVNEQRDELGLAQSWIYEAIDRDEQDWQLWLVAARLETKLGNVDAAERTLRRAVELNPRSPLFAGLLDDVET